MKKLLSILLLGAMLVGVLASCDSGEGSENTGDAAQTTTKAPSTTTTANKPAVTTPTPIDPTDEPTAETPMALADVENWMASHTLLNDKIDTNSYFASEIGFFADGGLPNLFDHVFTEAEWNAATEAGEFEAATHGDWVDTNGSGIIGDMILNADGTENWDKWIALGKMGFSGTTGAFFWAMTEPVTLGSYVIYTGNDNSQFPNRNPVGWKIYATNDDALGTRPEDATEYTWTTPSALKDAESLTNAGWILLDDVYDGAMEDANFTPFGYEIDADKQGEYKYYCWFIDYGGDDTSLMQMTGLKLYAA